MGITVGHELHERPGHRVHLVPGIEQGVQELRADDDLMANPARS